jgi:hypothetical protein
MDHIHVSSVCFRAEQEDKDGRQRTVHATPTGGDQLLPCLHKAARWLLTTPLKIGWTVQGARGGRQPPPLTPVDRRHCSAKTTSTEDQRQQLSLLLGRLWQPLSQDDKGKEVLGAIKGGEAAP